MFDALKPTGIFLFVFSSITGQPVTAHQGEPYVRNGRLLSTIVLWFARFATPRKKKEEKRRGRALPRYSKHSLRYHFCLSLFSQSFSPLSSDLSSLFPNNRCGHVLTLVRHRDLRFSARYPRRRRGGIKLGKVNFEARDLVPLALSRARAGIFDRRRRRLLGKKMGKNREVCSKTRPL